MFKWKGFRFGNLKMRFHEVVILGGSKGSIACFLFYLVLKMLEVPVWKILTKKIYEAWPTAVKNQQIIKILLGEHTKRVNYYFVGV